MAQVSVTALAKDLGSNHAMTEIPLGTNIVISSWRVKAWPTAARIVFRIGTEQGFATTNTTEFPLFLEIVILARKGSFCTFLASDVELGFG